MGMLDTGGNTYIIRLWERQSPPYLQGLHFAFGIGAFLAPLIAEPFLSTAPTLINAPSLELINLTATSPTILSRRKRAEEEYYESLQNLDDLDDPEAVKKFAELSAELSTQATPVTFFAKELTTRLEKSRPSSIFTQPAVILTSVTTTKTTTVPPQFTVDSVITTNTTTASTSTTTTTPAMAAELTDSFLNNSTTQTITNSTSSSNGTSSSPSASTVSIMPMATILNASETTTTLKPRKPSLNDGQLLPDQSASSADSSKNEGQIKKDTIAQGSDVPVARPPQPPPPVEQPTSSSTTSTSTTTSPPVGPPVVANISSPDSTNSSDSTPNNFTTPVAIIVPTPIQPAVNNASLSVSALTMSDTSTTSTTSTTSSSTTSTSTMPTPPSPSTSSIQPLLVPVQQNLSTVAPTPSQNTTLLTSPSTTTTPVPVPDLAPSPGGVSRVHIAFLIVAIILGVIAAACVIVGLSERLSLPCSGRENQLESGGLYRTTSDQNAGESSTADKLLEGGKRGTPAPENSSMCPSGFHIQLLVLLFIFYLLYVGGEVSFGQFISAYAERAQHWTRQDAAYVASAFWGALALGRGAAIPLSRYLKPAAVIAIDLTLLTVAMLGLLIGAQSFDTALWLCAAVAGLGMSSIFASGFLWTERHIPITGKISSVLVAGSAVGEMVLPVLAGFFFVRNPQSLTYLMAAISLLLAVLFVLLQNLALNGQDGQQSYARSGKRFGYDNDEDESEVVEISRHEAVRLLPMGNGNARLESPASPSSNGKNINETPSRRSGAGSSASGNSNSSRSHDDIFDDKQDSGIFHSDKKVSVVPSNGSAVLIGDDEDDDEEGNENFFDAFPVMPRGSGNSKEDTEVLLMDRRNIPSTSLWNRSDNNNFGSRTSNNRLIPQRVDSDRNLLL